MTCNTRTIFFSYLIYNLNNFNIYKIISYIIFRIVEILIFIKTYLFYKYQIKKNIYNYVN